MAIPITVKALREAIEPVLHELYDEVFNPGWAVYLERDNLTGAVTIEKIEEFALNVGKVMIPQIPGKHRYIIRVTDCRDEIDAYMKAKKILEERS